MTVSVIEATTAAEGRWLGELGKALERRLNQLQHDYLSDRPIGRANLARLRRGLGKPAGDVPEIWELTIGGLPEKLAGRNDAPSRAEQAAHLALTLYALHQQSQRVGMHQPAISIGRAVGKLREAPDVSSEAVVRRFMAVSTAQSVDEVVVHVRGLITQLRSHAIGLDYARFADDLRSLLTPGYETQVRLRWGRDFYRSDPAQTAAEEPTPTVIDAAEGATA